MRALLREVMVLLSGGLTWEPSVGHEQSRGPNYRLEATMNPAVRPPTARGATDSMEPALPRR
jgi:hypothetical protein